MNIEARIIQVVAEAIEAITADHIQFRLDEVFAGRELEVSASNPQPLLHKLGPLNQRAFRDFIPVHHDVCLHRLGSGPNEATIVDARAHDQPQPPLGHIDAADALKSAAGAAVEVARPIDQPAAEGVFHFLLEPEILLGGLGHLVDLGTGQLCLLSCLSLCQVSRPRSRASFLASRSR